MTLIANTAVTPTENRLTRDQRHVILGEPGLPFFTAGRRYEAESHCDGTISVIDDRNRTQGFDNAICGRFFTQAD